MDSSWILADDITVRREWFGCLVLSSTRGQFWQFNSDAFEILRHLVVSQTAESLVVLLSDRGFSVEVPDLESFVFQMVGCGVIKSGQEVTCARVLYAEQEDFRRDCLVAPSNVTLYMTERCGKKCRHCVVGSSPTADCSGELSVERWLSVLDELHTFGVMSVVFTGGEPLMKEGIFDIVHHADELGFAISFMTDYDRISTWHLEQLGSLRHLVDLQTSLDGANFKTHDFVRGRGSFGKALRRMDLFRGHGLRFTVSSTIGKHNLNEVAGIAAVDNEAGASYLYVNPLAPYGRARNRMASYVLSDDELRRLGLEYYRLAQEGVIDTGNSFWQYPGHDLELFHPFRGVLDVVSLAICNLSLDGHGNCYLDSKMKSEGLICLGNAIHDSLSEMWSDPRLNDLRSRYESGGLTFIDRSLLGL